jgi:hypothetical protein
MKKPKPKKPTKDRTRPPLGDLEEAREVRSRVMELLDSSDATEIPKLIDSYTRISNTVRQLEKQRRRDLVLYTIDELAAHIRTLDERKRELLIDQIGANHDEDDDDDLEDDQ